MHTKRPKSEGAHRWPKVAHHRWPKVAQHGWPKVAQPKELIVVKSEFSLRMDQISLRMDQIAYMKKCTCACIPHLLDCFFWSVATFASTAMATLASATMATLTSPRFSTFVATLASASMQNVVTFASVALYIGSDICLSSYATCGDIRLSSFVY